MIILHTSPANRLRWDEV